MITDTGFVAVAFLTWAYNVTDWDNPFVAGTTTPSFSISVGPTYQEFERGGTEYRLRYNSGRMIGAVQLIAEGAVTDRDALYIGFGGRLQHDFELVNLPLFATASVLAGYYERGNDFDGFSPLLFRADVEVGARLNDKTRLGLAWDHRSHGYVQNLFDPDAPNGGIEALTLRLTRDF